MNKNVNKWLVELAGDGSHWSFLVNGKINELKEALKREDAEDFINDLEDEDLWDMYGVFNLDVEQGYLRIIPIRAKYKNPQPTITA